MANQSATNISCTLADALNLGSFLFYMLAVLDNTLELLLIAPTKRAVFRITVV